MGKLIGLILNFTKIGKTVKTVQTAVDGKKQAIASLGTAIAGTIAIVMNFGAEGTPYLLKIASTPEFLAASGGWIAFFNAMKGEKIRHENAVIIEQNQKLLEKPVAVVVEPPVEQK